MRIEFHREAEVELRETAARYEAEREGLGEAFFDAISERLGDFSSLPGIPRRDAGSPGDMDVRRLLLRRFPYTLVLALESAERAVVVAVSHERREPGYWASRLDP